MNCTTKTWTFEQSIDPEWTAIGQWHITEEDKFLGTRSLTSGGVEFGTPKNISINVIGPAEIKFNWRKSSLYMDNTILGFYIDDKLILMCDSQFWNSIPEFYSIDDNNSHTIKWSFKLLNPAKGFNGRNIAAYIDNLVITSCELPTISTSLPSKQECFYRNNTEVSYGPVVYNGNWYGESSSEVNGKRIKLYSKDNGKGDHYSTGVLYDEFTYDKPERINNIKLVGRIKGELWCGEVPSLPNWIVSVIAGLPTEKKSKIDVFMALHDKTDDFTFDEIHLFGDETNDSAMWETIKIDEPFVAAFDQKYLYQNHTYQIKLTAKASTRAQGLVGVTADFSSNDYGIYWQYDEIKSGDCQKNMR